jgi:hypothetical protein
MINDVLKLHYMTILNLSKTPTLYHWVTRGLLRKIFSILIELSSKTEDKKICTIIKKWSSRIITVSINPQPVFKGIDW